MATVVLEHHNWEWGTLCYGKRLDY